MERTGSLHIVELEAPAVAAHVPREHKTALDTLALQMLEAGRDLAQLIQVTLDGLVHALGFERGFLVVADSDAVLQVQGAFGFTILGARGARRRDAVGRTSSRSALDDLPQPETAIHRTVVERALQSVQAFVIQDCLLAPHPHAEEARRAVLCQPFSATPGRRAVLYLDTTPAEHLPAVDLATLIDFNERCLPILKVGLLEAEIVALRKRPEGETADLDAPAVVSTVADGPGSDVPGERLPAPGSLPRLGDIIGGSERMRKIFQVIEKIKDSDLNVCVFGESGTGKELVARAIHDRGRRCAAKFVSENCGTIVETLLESELFGHERGAFTGADEARPGLFTVASGGTLFLDEISDMSEGMQRKLLRVLQEGVLRPIGSKHPVKVDTRVICASNRNLLSLVKSGAFRMDLFYRINVISIELPPLRERKEDLPLLVAHFLAELEREEGHAYRVSDSALEAFHGYSWPGNVRELRNLLRRAAVTANRRIITARDVQPLFTQEALGLEGDGVHRSGESLAFSIPHRGTFHEIIAECERVVLLNALKECRWNKSKVVKNLKIPRQSLYNLIARHGIEKSWEKK